jgi:hypothetical protein
MSKKNENGHRLCQQFDGQTTASPSGLPPPMPEKHPGGGGSPASINNLDKLAGMVYSILCVAG